MKKQNMSSSNQILGSILAKERVSFNFDKNAPTASINMKTKQITFPVFSDEVPSEVSDHLLSHEASHALNTDENFMDVLKDRKPKGVSYTYAKNVFNVVEDVRIERLMKNSYPGLPNIYRKSYGYLHETLDLFKIDQKGADEAGFINRINLFYKLGDHLKISFNPDEQKIISRLNTLLTQKDAYDITIDLLKIKEEQDAPSGDMELSWSDDSGEGDSDEGDEDGISVECDIVESEDDIGISKVRMEEDAYDINSPDIDYSKIDKIKSGYNEKTIIRFDASGIKPMPLRTDQIFKGFKCVGDDSFNNIVESDIVKEIMNNTKRFGNSAASIFLSRMRANEYARTQTYRSGSLDMKALHRYKIDDNIFKTKTLNSTGKNHGIVMFVDTSGSMTWRNSLKQLLMQTMNFISFCERVNIPFKVYSHRECYYDNTACKKNLPNSPVQMSDSSPMYILISSDMDKEKYNNHKMLMCASISSSCYCGVYTSGFTAMESTMIGAMDDVEIFKKKHDIEILHAVMMTDGMDNRNPISRGENRWPSYANNMIPYLKDGCTRLDFSNRCENSIYGTAEVFSKQLGCNMNYLMFGNKVGKTKNIGGNIWFKENDFGFKKEFYFASSTDPLYDCSNSMADKSLDIKSKKKLMRKMNKVNQDNSLFIKIFATAIAEGGYIS